LVTSLGDRRNVITCSVPFCGNPATGGYMCGVCLGRLDGDLAAVAELVADLEATTARQTRTGHRVGSRPAETGLPFNDGAAAVRDDLHNVLSTWVRDLWESCGPWREAPTGETGPDGAPVVEWALDPLDLDDTLPEMAAWLRRHPSWIAQHPAAGELVDEIGDAVDRARRAVDLPPARVFCGPCPDCGADLYARPERAIVGCRECGARHDVEARRAALLDAARRVDATAAEIARALPALLGRELSANTVRTWARNGRLTRRKPDERGRPRYLVGEVIDLALTTATRSRVTRDASASA
jgi:hypothetical protein